MVLRRVGNQEKVIRDYDECLCEVEKPETCRNKKMKKSNKYAEGY